MKTTFQGIKEGIEIQRSHFRKHEDYTVSVACASLDPQRENFFIYVNHFTDHYYAEYEQGKKDQIASLRKLDKHKVKLTREALLKATSAQTSALVAAAQAARSSLQIAKLARKAQEISVRRASWVLKTVRTAAKAEEVAVNAIESLFM
ncbi:uncharacterized protein LOC110248628 [Exaiptasia diaphana]|uniref:Uncharacterized protein n=1 Tax=Exaiptasia diaphana TaxID=2652724 RepID=A0A913XXM0_EXADI|nr:uncharacterized protein LOC110248628 [Exaiptasia diaphana]